VKGPRSSAGSAPAERLPIASPIGLLSTSKPAYGIEALVTASKMAMATPMVGRNEPVEHVVTEAIS
jgi:hypothetical protein